MISESPTEDELLFWLGRARARLASTTIAEERLEPSWVPASAGDVQSPAAAAGELTRWMLAAGTSPTRQQDAGELLGDGTCWTFRAGCT